MQYQTDYPPLLCTTSRVSPRSVGMRWSGAEPNTYAPFGIMTSGAGVHTPMSCASYMIIFSTPTLHKHFRAPSNVSNTCRLNTSSPLFFLIRTVLLHLYEMPLHPLTISSLHLYTMLSVQSLVALQSL